MTEQMTPLRRRMIDDMIIRHMSPLTQGAYVRAVRPEPGWSARVFQSGRVAAT